MAVTTVKKGWGGLSPQDVIYDMAFGIARESVKFGRSKNQISFIISEYFMMSVRKNAKSFEKDTEVKRGKRQKYKKIINLTYQVNCLSKKRPNPRLPNYYISIQMKFKISKITYPLDML